ncbi:MAG TPA: fibronectin type III domain-containing protein, partial [Fimbriiglobus sp.]|nr:fibronectin type III domain-containing protein [Fimbriiglobus sp.]
TAGQTYYLVADGATSDAFGMGAYELNAQFSGGGSTVTAPQAPGGLVAVATTTTQVDLSWQDNSGNEDGFRIERSTDGFNFTPVGTADANATSYTVTGLAADTTYYFHVQAVNGGGASAWSDTALAATPPEPTPVPPPAPPPAPPPPSLAPDRFEANETAAAARDLGKFNSNSQTALTINSSADVDWFTFTVNSSASFQVSITFAQAAGNLDLYVFDAQQRMMAGGTSASDNEAVSTSFTGGKQYYIKVVSPVGAENSYDLTITKLNGKNSRGGANLVLDLHGPDSLAAGVALVSGDPLPGSGSQTDTGTTTPPPVADDGTGAQSGRPDSPGRSADSPGYRWSQSLRLLQDLDLPVRDGLADLLGVAGKLV